MASYCDGCARCKPTHWTCNECNGTWAYGNGVVQPHEIRFDITGNCRMKSVQYLLCENCYSEAPVECCNCLNETTHEQLEDDEGCMECGLGIYSDGCGIACHECSRSYSDCCDWRNGYSKLDWFYGDGCCEELTGGDWIMICPYCQGDEETMEYYDKLCDEIIQDEHQEKLELVNKELLTTVNSSMALVAMKQSFKKRGNLVPNLPIDNVLNMLSPNVARNINSNKKNTRVIMCQMTKLMSIKDISCQA